MIRHDHTNGVSCIPPKTKRQFRLMVFPKRNNNTQIPPGTNWPLARGRSIWLRSISKSGDLLTRWKLRVGVTWHIKWPDWAADVEADDDVVGHPSTSEEGDAVGGKLRFGPSSDGRRGETELRIGIGSEDPALGIRTAPDTLIRSIPPQLSSVTSSSSSIRLGRLAFSLFPATGVDGGSFSVGCRTKMFVFNKRPRKIFKKF